MMKLMLYKCLFKVNVKYGYKIWKMDIMTAFLYRFLDKIIYIKQFYLFELNFELVCQLHKALYGLKQAL